MKLVFFLFFLLFLCVSLNIVLVALSVVSLPPQKTAIWVACILFLQCSHSLSMCAKERPARRRQRAEAGEAQSRELGAGDEESSLRKSNGMCVKASNLSIKTFSLFLSSSPAIYTSRARCCMRDVSWHVANKQFINISLFFRYYYFFHSNSPSLVKTDR